MTSFSSVLSSTIRSYLTLKRALGRQYASEEWVLAHLDRFLAARRVDLVAVTFAAWCLTLQHLASGTRRARMRVVRNLCLYRRRNERGCFVPGQAAVPVGPPSHPAAYLHRQPDSPVVGRRAHAGPTSSFSTLSGEPAPCGRAVVHHRAATRGADAADRGRL